MPITPPLWQEIEKIIVRYPHKQGAILPVLHKIQEEQGFLAEDVLVELSEYLQIPQVNLFEVATFHTLFYITSQGKNIILACNSVSCYLLGAETLLQFLESELGVKVGETTADKKFSLQAVSCLGACDRGPAMLINDKLYTHLTQDRIKQILGQY